jgi:rubredoxin
MTENTKNISKTPESIDEKEPVSPRCPMCNTKNTVTQYHDGLGRDSPFHQGCGRYDKHFDHRCGFCGYIWNSSTDFFKNIAENADIQE